MVSNRATRDINESQVKSSLTPIEVRFSQAQSKLSNSRRQLIRAMLDNPEETFFLSSREMAKRYGVDAATIVRTVQALGYERFAEFVADLRQHFVTRITPYAVMKAATLEKRSPADHVLHSVDRDAENLSVFRSSLDTGRILELAKLIHRSQRILVVGVDLAASLSWFLAYGLLPLGFSAEAPVGTAGNLLHKVRNLTAKDLLIAISFGRCLKETVESVLRARERSVPTFGITDSDTTPLAIHCNDYIVAPVTYPSFAGSYVAPMALINAIIVACSHVRPGRSLSLLNQIEEEYKTGSRWYQESSRRAGPATKVREKLQQGNLKQSRKK